MSDRTRKPAAGTDVQKLPVASVDPSKATAPSNSAIQDELKGGNAYTDAFGDKAGGFLYDLVEDNASPEKIDGYAAKGLGSVGSWIGDKATDAASPEDKEAAAMFKAHITDAFKKGYGGQLAESGFGESISDWAKDSPWTVAGLGAAGAAAYVLSDQKLDDIDTKVKLGGGTSLLLGGDFGSTLHPGIDALRAGAMYKDGSQEFGLKGENRFDAPEWSLGAWYKTQGDWGKLAANADWHKQGDRNLAAAGLSFQNDKLAANLKGSYDSLDGGVGALHGDLRTLGEGPRWTAGFDANTKGQWNVEGGVSHKTGDLEWFAKGFGGRGEDGKTDFGARAGLSYRF
ncbi:MAG: hypothetical protein H6737_08840 [Alphaproteobacteria bacterium]|nr:hypothetical protein [Alphaproteobacteria bacterium]